jgi:transglutaminase-like putative cysteine protease
MSTPRVLFPRAAFRLALAAAFVLGLACSAAASPADGTHYYAIEINGTLCGYTKSMVSTERIDGEDRMVIDEEVFLMLTVLGSQFNTEVESHAVVDPATWNFLEQEVSVEQGPNTITFSAQVDGANAHVESSLLGGAREVALPEDVVLENSQFFPHVLRDLLDAEQAEVSYQTLEVREAAVQEQVYTRVAVETLELSTGAREALVVDKRNAVTGLTIRMWIDADDATFLRAEIPGGRVVYRTDPSVTKKVEVANLDDSITAKVAVSIADFQAIESMKVRAVLEPFGLNVTPESLNVPGQKFEGTVVDNRIEGVFEIAHPRYDGAGAPPFPPDFSKDPALAPYLRPGPLVESDDEVLVAHAKALTAGSANSWEAVRRISAWVASEIQYAIPGGGTARRTFDMRAGECGAHSNLVAGLSRAVGIPARVVWGSMYIPNFGGAFGQHGWNEVFMGEAGWIPIDATANETDYVDSGHVRIGVHESLTTGFNPIEMEVLAHTLAGADAPGADAGKYAAYLGTFAHPQAPDRAFEVSVQGGALVATIPGQVALALNDPDDRGRWVAKASDRVYVEFGKAEDGTFDSMTIHEMVRMQRTAPPGSIPEDVPEEMKPLLGSYFLAQANGTFVVLWDDGRLAVHDPFQNVDVHLGPPDEDGWRLDEFDKNSIRFDEDDTGAIAFLTIDAANRFERK